MRKRADKAGKIFQPLVDELGQSIRSGKWFAGQCLPSEKALSGKYGISRVSVRQALRELETRGLIYRRPGKGTFVADSHAGLPPVGRRILAISFNFTANRPAGIFFGPIFYGIQQAAEANKCRLEFLNDNALLERAPDLLGYIGISFDHRRIDSLQKLQPKTPVVLINRLPSEHPFHCVTIDHAVWARRAMEYLIGLGHRRVALVATASGPGFIQHRLAGARAARAPGAGQTEEHAVFLDDQPENLSRLRRLLAERKITALFLLMGNVVPRVLALIREVGLRVPDDIAVLAFDDVPHPFHPWMPGLTAVRQPLEEMGRRAVQLLGRIHAGKITERQVEFVPAELVVRESCRALA